MSFDLWRQMTVEHIIGKSQGGYLPQIRDAVAMRFPGLSTEQKEAVARRLDEANTVSACSFCNSTTSRNVHERSMSDLLNEATGDVEEVIVHAKAEFDRILQAKRINAQWKLRSVREAFERDVLPKLSTPAASPSGASSRP